MIIAHKVSDINSDFLFLVVSRLRDSKTFMLLLLTFTVLTPLRLTTLIVFAIVSLIGRVKIAFWDSDIDIDFLFLISVLVKRNTFR